MGRWSRKKAGAGSVAELVVVEDVEVDGDVLDPEQPDAITKTSAMPASSLAI
jgi:hypothetical protein